MKLYLCSNNPTYLVDVPNMKLLYTLISFFLLTNVVSYSQVGINTTNPQADLDVEGTIRIGKRLLDNYQAVRLLGVDANGMIMELDMDDNIYIDGDMVRTNSRRETIYTLIVDAEALHNAADIIWPGGTGNGKSVVRIDNVQGDLDLTGIDMSIFASPLEAHGITVVFYSVSGYLRLSDQDANSLPINQILLPNGNTLMIPQYQMIKMMYDGILEKWIIQNRH